MKQQLIFDSPILPGSVTIAWSRCGKAECSCKAQPPKLHGPYYRWTGFISGHRTTKTISKEVATECRRRIANFRRLQKEIDVLLRKATSNAPWVNESDECNSGKFATASASRRGGNVGN